MIALSGCVGATVVLVGGISGRLITESGLQTTSCHCGHTAINLSVGSGLIGLFKTLSLFWLGLKWERSECQG